jgi:tetratricopeptide (TPR) repeat protein
MLYNIIPIIVILVCLSILIALLIRKFPQISDIEVSALSEEQDAQKRQAIIKRRWHRVVNEKKQKIHKIYVKVKNIFNKIYRNLYRSYKDLNNQELSKNLDPQTVNQKLSTIETNLKQARNYFKKEEYDKAEDCYIDILNLDSKNLKAYEGMVDIFIIKKEYDKAKETLIYILKIIRGLKKDDAKIIDNAKIAEFHFQLAEVFYEQQDNILAVEHYKKACFLCPNNPRYLDKLIESALILKDVKLAMDTYNKLMSVNPENKKLKKMGLQIRELM